MRSTGQTFTRCDYYTVPHASVRYEIKRCDYCTVHQASVSYEVNRSVTTAQDLHTEAAAAAQGTIHPVLWPRTQVAHSIHTLGAIYRRFS